MKRTLLVAAVASLLMTSCKKDYTCLCKDSDTKNPDDFTLKYNDTKANAKAACEAQHRLWAPFYSCSIK